MKLRFSLVRAGLVADCWMEPLLAQDDVEVAVLVDADEPARGRRYGCEGYG